MKEIITYDFQETKKIGQEFGKKIIKRKKGPKSFVVALYGDLGSGKTTFVQGMAEGLGVKEQITSPSFVLIKKYSIFVKEKEDKQKRIKNFYHIDCYRLEKPWQLQELGFEKIINNPDNIVVIEWADKIIDILPKNKIVIKFIWLNKNKRRIIFG